MRWPIALPLMLAVTIVQVAVFDQVLFGGQIRLDLPLYLLVAIGLSTQSTNAALAGFTLGVVVDLFQFGPFGVHAMIYCLAGWVLAEGRQRVLQDGAGSSIMQGAVATLVVTVLTWLIGSVFGQDPFALNQGPWGVLGTLAIAGLLGGVAVRPMARITLRMTTDIGREQRRVRV